MLSKNFEKSPSPINQVTGGDVDEDTGELKLSYIIELLYLIVSSLRQYVGCLMQHQSMARGRTGTDFFYICVYNI
jgi:hypothetical protein